jgi:Protein of unknown function (DUF4242)
MKIFFVLSTFLILSILSCNSSTPPSTVEATPGKDTLPPPESKLDSMYFMDVHHLGAGKVTYEAAAQAHAKDLAVQSKYGVQFLKYWVDINNGDIYCLASAADAQSLLKTHSEAHGLLPDHIYQVAPGEATALEGKKNLYMDIHYLGAGKVTAKDVAGAHQKDLAIEKKYGVNIANYWFDEKSGVVMCLAEAKDSTSLIQTHKEAHGLLPAHVVMVKQGK